MALGSAISNKSGLTGTGNDVDYYSVSLSTGNVLIGMTTPVSDLPTTLAFPDTIASVLLGGAQLTFSDDDDAGETPDTGFNHGSLFRFALPVQEATELRSVVIVTRNTTGPPQVERTIKSAHTFSPPADSTPMFRAEGLQTLIQATMQLVALI